MSLRGDTAQKAESCPKGVYVQRTDHRTHKIRVLRKSVSARLTRGINTTASLIIINGTGRRKRARKNLTKNIHVLRASENQLCRRSSTAQQVFKPNTHLYTWLMIIFVLQLMKRKKT